MKRREIKKVMNVHTCILKHINALLINFVNYIHAHCYKFALKIQFSLILSYMYITFTYLV